MLSCRTMLLGLCGQQCLDALIRWDSNTDIVAVLVARFFSSPRGAISAIGFRGCYRRSSQLTSPLVRWNIHSSIGFPGGTASSMELFASCRTQLRRLATPRRRYPPINFRKAKKGRTTFERRLEVIEAIDVLARKE